MPNQVNLVDYSLQIGKGSNNDMYVVLLSSPDHSTNLPDKYEAIVAAVKQRQILRWTPTTIQRSSDDSVLHIIDNGQPKTLQLFNCDFDVSEFASALGKVNPQINDFGELFETVYPGIESVLSGDYPSVAVMMEDGLFRATADTALPARNAAAQRTAGKGRKAAAPKRARRGRDDINIWIGGA